jgi:hypothetical protein
MSMSRKREREECGVGGEGWPVEWGMDRLGLGVSLGCIDFGLPNEMNHPVDGEAWQDFDSKHETFAADANNLRLAIAIDGFNPFVNFSSAYRTWPVLVTPLNLPPWECVSPSNCFMSLLIPGPTSPGKDFDLFLEPLIEELLKLWKGVKT